MAASALLVLLLVLSAAVATKATSGTSATSSTSASASLLDAGHTLVSITPNFASKSKPDHRVLRTLSTYEVHDLRPLARVLQARDQSTSTDAASATTLRMRFLGETWDVKLEPHHDLFAPGYAHHVLDASGNVVESHGPLDCIFKAKTDTMTGTFSLCKGHISGLLHGPGRAVSIEPLTSGAHRALGADSEAALISRLRTNHHDTDGLHVVFDHTALIDDGLKPECREPTQDELESFGHRRTNNGDPRNPKQAVASSSRLATAPQTSFTFLNARQKVTGLTVFNDFAFSQLFGNATQAQAVSIVAQVRSMHLRLANETMRDGTTPAPYFLDVRLSRMFTFQFGDPYGTPASMLTANGLVSVSGLLSTFSSFHANFSGMTGLRTDVAHLLSASGWDPQNGAVGMAWVSGMCSAGQFLVSGITRAAGTIGAAAVTMAHELGHNAGARHDEVAVPGLTPPTCTNSSNPLTAPGIMLSNSAGSRLWSTCTVEWLRRFFAPGGAYNTAANPACAEVADQPELVPNSGSVCGNGLVEPGEQCDCLGGDCAVATKDPCCDAATCRLKPGATCSPAQWGCCNPNTCAMQPRGALCRAKSSPCDVEDRCSGSSLECPDYIVPPFTPCFTPRNTSGQCACGGSCLSAFDICKNQGGPTWLGPCYSTQGYVAPGNCGGDMWCYTDASSPGSCVAWGPLERVWPSGVPCGPNSVCQGTRCVPKSQFTCPGKVLATSSPSRAPVTARPSTKPSAALATSSPTRSPSRNQSALASTSRASVSGLTGDAHVLRVFILLVLVLVYSY